MLKFLNENANALTFIANLTLVVVTIVYVVVNAMMHREMRRTRANAEKPDLSIRFEKVISGFFDIILENFSNNEIFDLKFEEYPTITEKSIGHQPGFILQGVKYMGPKQSFRSWYINYPALVQNRDHEKDIVFKLSYADRSGKRYSKEFAFNLNLFYDNQMLSKKGASDFYALAEKFLKTIEKGLEKN